MRKLLLIALSLALCLGLATTALAEDEYGVIQGGSLRMRSGPSADAAIVRSYANGTWVEILDAQGDFYHVKTDDGHEGYMMSQYIIHDTLEAGSWGTVENGSRYVNLRSGPSTTYSVIGTFNTGDRFEVLEYGEIFSKVRFEGSVVGYMSSGLIRLDNETVWQEEYVHTTYGSKLNLRQGPSTDAAVLGSYPVGTEVIVLIKGNTWSKVFVDDTFGYMDSQYLAPTSAAVALAKTADTTTEVAEAEITDNEDFVPDETFYDGVGYEVDASEVDG